MIEVILEPLNPFRRNVSKGEGIPAVVDFQVMVTRLPVTPITFTLFPSTLLDHCTVIVIETCFRSKGIIESEHPISQFHHTLRTNSISKPHSFLVLLPVRPCNLRDKI